MKKVYLSGPMRGYKDFNFPLFYTTEALLELWGWAVSNPARLDIEDGKAAYNVAEKRIVPDTSFTIADALRRDFTVILSCDAVALLPGWEKSEGACRELGLAIDIGLPVYFVNPIDGALTAAPEQDLRRAVAIKYCSKAGMVGQFTGIDQPGDRERVTAHVIS